MESYITMRAYSGELNEALVAKRTAFPEGSILLSFCPFGLAVFFASADLYKSYFAINAFHALSLNLPHSQSQGSTR